MSAFSPQSFSLAFALHAGVALCVALWSWFQPPPKPSIAIFEVVSAPPALEDSADPRPGRAQEAVQAESAVAEKLEPMFEKTYRHIKIPTPAPVQAEPDPAPTKATPPDALVRNDPKAKPADKKTASKKQTLADFQKQTGKTPKVSSTTKGATSQPAVRAPRIDTSDIAQGLKGAMGNAASRNRAAGLTASEQGELNEYYSLLRALLENAWVRPEGVSSRLRCTVVFTVTGGGSIVGAKITDGSGASVFDESVMEVFQQVRSYNRPPNGQSWTFEITFGLEE